VFRVRIAVEGPAPARVRVEGPAFHHLRVARVAVGEVVEAFDGRGRAWAATVESVTDNHAVLALGAARTEDAGRRVLLLQGLPKGEKLDWVLQKTTELGVAAVWPLALARSVVKLGPDVARKRQVRWQRIAEEAARQSGRADVPEVGPLRTLEQALAALPAGVQLLVLDEEERERRLSEAGADDGRPLALVVGPEGGLERTEVEQVRRAGGEAVTMGRRVLRTETVGLVALAVLRHREGLLG
jgi:16S rRNA (uracil1498-N3)-methyltransferase